MLNYISEPKGYYRCISKGEFQERPLLGCAVAGCRGCHRAVVPAHPAVLTREGPVPTAAFIGKHCVFAEGLSSKAMVTAATLCVSLGDEAPTKACRA